MPFFYRGAGVGTYWHQRDARLDGFVARQAFERALADLQTLATKAAGSEAAGTASDSKRIATAIEDLKAMTRKL